MTGVVLSGIRIPDHELSRYGASNQWRTLLSHICYCLFLGPRPGELNYPRVRSACGLLPGQAQEQHGTGVGYSVGSSPPRSSTAGGTPFVVGGEGATKMETLGQRVGGGRPKATTACSQAHVNAGGM